MSSFFGAIQGWFTAGFHGRHLGLILQELGKFQQDAITSFVAASCGINMRDLKGARFETEVAFQPGKGKHYRRADLGVFLEDHDEPIVLVEIKYFDKPVPETDTKPAQLSDYVSWKRAGKNRHVLILSREIFQSDELVLQRWDAFARHLRSYAKESDLIKMLVEYLEEEANVMQNINGISLMRYFKRLVCHTRQSGRAANNIEGPEQFTKLMKNLKLLSGNFAPKFRDAWRDAGHHVDGIEGSSRTASIDFMVRNSLEQIKDANDYLDDDGELDSSYKTGGYIEVFATHSLGHGNSDWLRIDYGILFGVAPDNDMDSPPTVKLFALARGRKIKDSGQEFYCDHSVSYKLVTDKADTSVAKVEHRFHQLLKNLMDELVEAKLPVQPVQKKTLTLLKRSLATLELSEHEAA